jgi:hypothetical protein
VDAWYLIALVLLIVATVVSVLQRAWVMALLCAGLAAWVLPVAWAARH